MFSISYPGGTVRKNGVVITDLTEYVDFLKGGGAPEPLEDEPNPYPRIEVTSWQLIQALAIKGWLQAVEDAVVASGNILVQKGWQRAPKFWSDDALVSGLSAAIGKNQEEVYEVFELAARL